MAVELRLSLVTKGRDKHEVEKYLKVKWANGKEKKYKKKKEERGETDKTFREH